MGRRPKKDQDQLQEEIMSGNDDGTVRNFDPNKHVPALGIVRTGLAIMANEMQRMVDKSKNGGLNGFQSMALKEYVRLASDVAKKHKALDIEFLNDDELATMPQERLEELLQQSLAAIDRSKVVNEEMRIKPKIMDKSLKVLLMEKGTDYEN
jgi:hypothetical protein